MTGFLPDKGPSGPFAVSGTGPTQARTSSTFNNKAGCERQGN